MQIFHNEFSLWKILEMNDSVFCGVNMMIQETIKEIQDDIIFLYKTIVKNRFW